MENDKPGNWHKKVRVAILISEKVVFKTKHFIRDKGGHL